MGREDFVVLFRNTHTHACAHPRTPTHKCTGLERGMLLLSFQHHVSHVKTFWEHPFENYHIHMHMDAWMHIQSNTHTHQKTQTKTLNQTVVSLSRTLIQKALSSITFNYSWQPLALIYTKHVQTSCYTLPPRKGDRRGRQAACLPAEKALSVHDMDMGSGDPAGARLHLLAGWRLRGRHVASAAMGLGMSVGLGPALCSPGLSTEL